MTRKPDFELGADAKAIEAFLKEKPCGTVILYEALNQLIEGNVQKENRHSLTTAIRRLRNNDAMLWVTVRGIGIERVAANRSADVASHRMKKIRTQTRLGAQEVRCSGDLGELTNEERIKVNSVASLLGALNVMTQPKSMRHLESTISKENKKLAVDETIEAFRTNSRCQCEASNVAENGICRQCGKQHAGIGAGIHEP